MTSSMSSEEDDSSNGFLANVYDFKIGGDDEDDTLKMTYESVNFASIVLLQSLDS